jgi:hypothetical protein
MTWNYRVIKSHLPNGEEEFGIHEVYYDENGNPSMTTERAIAAYGETLDELRADVQRQLEALSKPVLTMDDFVGTNTS